MIALIVIVLVAMIVYVCMNRASSQGVHGGTQNEEGKKQNDNEESGNIFIVYHTSVSILIVHVYVCNGEDIGVAGRGN